MCNACGFYCCASDQFSGCGCEHCPCSECWPDDPDDDDLDQLYDDDVLRTKPPEKAAHAPSGEKEE